MAMNLKKIVTKLNSLKADKEKIEKKKAEMIRDFDAQIEELNNQITKYDGFRKTIEKLQRQLEDQLGMAEDFASEIKGRKDEDVPAEEETDTEIVEEDDEESFEMPNFYSEN